MTGHLLGGAGGIESVFTVVALHNPRRPHHQHLQSRPECDLDYCANTARELKIDAALKNNFGFWWHQRIARLQARLISSFSGRLSWLAVL